MIETEGLYYEFPNGSLGLINLSLKIPSRSRTILVGANGAGKSTLLRVLAGKTLVKAGAVLIDEKDPFRDTDVPTTYLGTEWASNTTVRRDIAVTVLISSIGGDAYPERRDELVDILDIDLSWHMHAVSDGERRRVQLCMGLLRPWRTLLLDEITVDLDVLVRSRLLNFLARETESRNCQIVYATHIFDGLGSWPSHVAHMHLGCIEEFADINNLYRTHSELAPIIGSSLLNIALEWLRKDLEERGERTKRPTWDELTKSGALNGMDKTRVAQYFKLTRGHV